ncbi:hypothetical protein Poli38472_004784 [Pythium oligandrum]|uniref:Uncharacterized protein n=1 Tax=Pythium oligandrum TaxID=41045 RepID=A0A8K1FDS1_PYTOL|nr:hypothetical protein Poli38472_004784 [Pythium oligandrum]|eukprot:TMW59715.1 hypothetical protein Poli38472_004784 [Pythium oligandrum]
MVALQPLFAVAMLAAPALVSGHGYMSKPKADLKWSQGVDTSAYVGRIDGSKSGLKAPNGMSFTGKPADNAKAFAAAIKTSGYSSVAQLIKAKAPSIPECGLSIVKNQQPLPAYVEWSHTNSEGFTPSHAGPCEVWCDSTRVAYHENCAASFPTAPAKVPYDKSKCLNKKQLKFVWLALHEIQWQVYINCAALKPEGRSLDYDEYAAAPGDEDCDDNLPEPGNDADCDDDLPEPGNDDDCDEEYPEPSNGEVGGDADCDDDLPEPGNDADCDDDLPEPGNGADDCDEEYPEPATSDDEYGGESNTDIDFSVIQRRNGSDFVPGRVQAEPVDADY